MSELIRDFRSSSADVAWLLCDRHPHDAVALTVVAEDLSVRDITFGELRELSEQCAKALAGLGVGPGDRVATLMGKGADLVAVVMGIWRLGAVYVPLFTAFGPQAIAARLDRSGAKVVVTDAGQRAKLLPGPDLPAPRGSPWSPEEARRRASTTWPSCSAPPRRTPFPKRRGAAHAPLCTCAPRERPAPPRA